MKKLITERFEEKCYAEPNTGCWLWTACVSEKGYGLFSIGSKRVRAHRVSYEIYVGAVGQMNVLHRCDTPSCVNPDHLFLGTSKDNSEDMVRKGRQTSGSRNGRAKITDAQALAIYLSDEHPEDLAQRYGLTRGAILSIRRKSSWKHIHRFPVVGEAAAPLSLPSSLDGAAEQEAPQTPEQPCPVGLSAGHGRGASTFTEILKCEGCRESFPETQCEVRSGPHETHEGTQYYRVCPHCGTAELLAHNDYTTPAEVWADTYDADWDGEGYIGSCECPHCGAVGNWYQGAMYKGDMEYECGECCHTSPEAA